MDFVSGEKYSFFQKAAYPGFMQSKKIQNII